MGKQLELFEEEEGFIFFILQKSEIARDFFSQDKVFDNFAVIAAFIKKRMQFLKRDNVFFVNTDGDIIVVLLRWIGGALQWEIDTSSYGMASVFRRGTRIFAPLRSSVKK